jgi:glycerophosphoryl diester phosphodiesterase
MKIYYLFFFSFLFIQCSVMRKPLNIGHRGAMGHETENTISSIKKALELHVDMIEIDVFVIKSGEVVVFHDDLLDSLTNAKGKIEDYNWEELENVTVKA